jgi:hypothetical protein
MLITIMLTGSAMLATLIIVDHPGVRLFVLTLLTLGGIAGWARWAMHRADSALDRARQRQRRRAGLLGLILALLSSACRPGAAKPPEPAEIATLDCGGRTCSIGQVGPSTIVWVTQ